MIKGRYLTVNQLIEQLQQIDPKYRDEIVIVDDKRLITSIWTFDGYPNIGTVIKPK